MNEMNERISRIGVVPVIKLNNPERDAAALGKALCAGGVPVAEVTFRAAGADKAIKLMKEANPEMIVGAGTVTNTAQIDAVIAAGGEFIVSPGFDPELVAYAQEKSDRQVFCVHRAAAGNRVSDPQAISVYRAEGNGHHDVQCPADPGGGLRDHPR